MTKEELKIVFMGTPAFAVESLRLLVEHKYNIVGVITMPDKPAGRGHKIQYSPVKQFALDNKLRLLQPERLKEESFIEELKSLQADIQIVVAFRMLPEVVWNMPPYGTFNLHASLLPQYRGAAPINWAIIRGEKETGATTFFLTHEIDTGRVILQRKIPVNDVDNAGTIHDKLMVLGAEMVVETVERVLSGNLESIEQGQLVSTDETLKSAPKIFKDSCEIHSRLTVEQAHNLVRGLSPYPAAWISIQLPGQTDLVSIKVFESEADDTVTSDKPGTFVSDGKTKAGVVMKDGILWFRVVQAPAKKRMPVEDWLRGLRI
ncbi:MAG: methionyl-tRNA formyltransferase [Paludibacter sp.]|nr:methionyl-tRNA formyltransferase [Paludibacter sp.]